MPAIRYAQTPERLIVANHVNQGTSYRLWLKGIDNAFVMCDFAGFICVPGTAHLKGGRLGKVVVKEITNGDGGANSVWRQVPPTEFVFAMVIRNDPKIDAYLILGDDAWPITTVDKFRNFEKCQPYAT